MSTCESAHTSCAATRFHPAHEHVSLGERGLGSAIGLETLVPWFESAFVSLDFLKRLQRWGTVGTGIFAEHVFESSVARNTLIIVVFSALAAGLAG